MTSMAMREKKKNQPGIRKVPLKKRCIRGWPTQLYKNLIINDIHGHEREKKKNQPGIRKVPLKNDS